MGLYNSGFLGYTTYRQRRQSPATKKGANNMVKTTLNIDGMMCSMCEAHMNDAIRRDFEVEKVTSSHAKKLTEIISQEPLDEEKLRKTVDATGYKLEGISSEPYEKKRFSLFGK